MSNITASEIQDTYIKIFNVHWWEKLFGIACIRFGDQEYQEIDIDAVLDVLEKDKTDQMTYSVDEAGNPLEWYDCDNFTAALKGAFNKNYLTAAMPIFETWVSNIGHALLTFWFDGEVFAIEPQTDQIYWLPEGEWKLSLLCG